MIFPVVWSDEVSSHGGFTAGVGALKVFFWSGSEFWFGVGEECLPGIMMEVLAIV